MASSFTGSSSSRCAENIAPSIIPFQPMQLNWNLMSPISNCSTEQPRINNIYSLTTPVSNEIDPWRHIFNDSYPKSNYCSNKITKPIAKKKQESAKPKIQDTNNNDRELDDYLIRKNGESIMNKLDQIAELLTTGIRTKKIKTMKKRTELLKTPDVYIEKSINLPRTPIIDDDEDEDEDDDEDDEQNMTRQEYLIREHQYMLQLQNYCISDDDSEGTVEEDVISNSSSNDNDNYDSDDSLGPINSPPIARRTDSRQTIQKSNSRPGIQNNNNNRPIGIDINAMEMYLPQFNVRSNY
jgi:hypothetical protein